MTIMKSLSIIAHKKIANADTNTTSRTVSISH